MAFESTAEPIKIGYLMDLILPEGIPETFRQDLIAPFDMVFEDALKAGVLDRPVEIVYREVEGLPKGTVKAVIDAYAELVDEGCLAIYGPNTGDNAVALGDSLDRRFRVPALSVTGSDDALGEWFFALPMGSHEDEPIFWADMLASAGHMHVGILTERSLIGEAYVKSFRKACRRYGIRIVAEAPIAQTAQDVSEAVRTLHQAKAEAIVHAGFGFGVVHVNAALAALGWDPPRFAGTAFENAWMTDTLWDAYTGWIGVDQYDESNEVGQRFLDDYQQRYGRRPQWCAPVVMRDLAVTLLEALTDAQPLSPRGVKEALERVKSVPAASGAPGTRVSFGKWVRRGWMGTGYLVARELNQDRVNSRLVARFGA